jgi:hypothetical protein
MSSSNLFPNASMVSLPSAHAASRIIALVQEQRKQSRDDGNTLNLRNLGIAETLPVEVIEMIKEEVSRCLTRLDLNIINVDLILRRISCFISIRSLKS